MTPHLLEFQTEDSACAEPEEAESVVRRVKTGVCALCITCRHCAQDRTVTCALCERCRICGVLADGEG